jgi:predicted ribosomally synthesized peptide with nif11-like leader
VSSKSNPQVQAFLSLLQRDAALAKQALQVDDVDAMAALAKAHGYLLTPVELLKFQAAQILRQPDAVLEQPAAQLQIRHWGCWLDVV